MYTTTSLQLATEIAVALGDMNGFALYSTYAQQYPETLLRELLERTLSIPEHKIKRSRGALFTYLVTQHAQHTPYPRR